MIFNNTEISETKTILMQIISYVEYRFDSGKQVFVKDILEKIQQSYFLEEAFWYQKLVLNIVLKIVCTKINHTIIKYYAFLEHNYDVKIEILQEQFSYMLKILKSHEIFDFTVLPTILIQCISILSNTNYYSLKESKALMEVFDI